MHIERQLLNISKYIYINAFLPVISRIVQFKAIRKMLSAKTLSALLLLFTFVVRNVPAGQNVDMVKRHLRWNANKDIVSLIGSNLRINYLQPHPKSMRVSDTSAIYMAFTLYKRNGAWIVPNTGVFHFADIKTASSLGSRCTPPTNHAGAYIIISTGTVHPLTQISWLPVGVIRGRMDLYSTRIHSTLLDQHIWMDSTI